MADEATDSVGTAYIDVRVRTATMQAGLDAAKSKVSNLGAQAEAEFNKANSSTKRYADSLLRQANTIGKTRAEQVAFNAQLKIGGELGKKIAETALLREAALKKETTAIAGAAAGYAATGKSAREMAFAMRTLPAQFTDIVTAIASGQRPTTILLQQGGQIKDMFGGIRPALSAVGSQLLKLINPYTAAAAAAGALLLAWKQGSDEIEAYNKALALTGSFAGKTADQLQDMAKALDNVSGVTEHAAAAAIAQVTQTGRFYGQQIETVSRAALEMQQATGQAIDKTIADFERLADDPVKAAVELNKQMHFLTVATYDQIKALEERGQKDQAAALAQGAYAKAIDQRSKSVRGSLGYLETGWNSVKDAAREAWDAMLNVGRPTTLQDKINTIQKQIETAQRNFVDPVTGREIKLSDREKAERDKTVENLRAQLRQLQLREQVAPGGDLYAAGQALAAQSAQKLIDQAEAKKDKAEHSSRASHGATTRDNSDKLRQMGIDDIQKQIEAQGKLDDAKAKANAANAADAAYAAQLQDQLSTRKQQIDLQIMAVGMGRQEYARQSELVEIYGRFDHQLAQLNQERDRGSITTEQYNRRLQDLKKNETDTINAVVSGFHKIDEARSDWRNGVMAALEDFRDQSADVAAQTQGVFTNLFNGMADSVANFVKTGKFNLEDLARSFLADVARMEAAAAESAIIGWLAHAFSGVADNGSAGYASYSAATYGNTAIGAGRAAGGPVEPGSIHPVVENGPELLKAGGTTYLMMGDMGGQVEPLRPVGASQGGGAGGNVYVSVEVKGGDGNAKVSQQQTTDGQGNKMIKLIIDQASDQAVSKVNSNIARGGSTGQILQQTFGLSRRGIPVAG